jgi:hypothetical protein
MDCHSISRQLTCLFVNETLTTWLFDFHVGYDYVIAHLSLPVPPGQRRAPPSPSRIEESRRSRLGLTSIAFADATLFSLLPDRSDVPALPASFAIEAVIPLLAFGCRTNGCVNALHRGINKPTRRIRSRRGAIRSFERSLGWGRTKPAAFCRWCANRFRHLFGTVLVPASSCIIRLTPCLDMSAVPCRIGRRR